MKRIFLILFFLFLYSFPVFAEPLFGSLKTHSNLPIKISILIDKSLVFQGEKFKLHLSVLVEEGWHIYSLQSFHGSESLATKILMDKNSFQGQSDWKGPDPILIKDGALDQIVKGYKGRIEFSKTYLAPINISPKVYSLTGNLEFRACNNRICTLPRKFPFHSQIAVSEH